MGASGASKVQALLTCSPGWKIHEQFLGRCEQDELARERVEWTVISPDAIRPEALAQAEVVVCGHFAREWLAHCRRLRWIQFLGAGIEGSLSPELLASDIILTNASGVHAIPIAEHVFGMMLMFARGLHRCVRQQMHAEWNRNGFREQVRELHGATLGVVGLGAIGTAVAERGKAFGMRVLATRRHPQRRAGAVDVLLPPSQLPDLLRESEYVVLCVPLTRETRHLIGEAELRQMRRDAILINISRGAVVDQPALIRALQEEWIAGAGLDVLDPEPLPTDSPLWRLPNVVISPHVSGVTPHYGTRAAEIFLRNLHAFLAGDFASMVNVVDKQEGY
ncbi:MAG: hydroxyacid dehydrogenase [Armatimonadota bacterium]|nr:MAG: hydroxyacid dehydrogenase [Armatimonadota bacterium]